MAVNLTLETIQNLPVKGCQYDVYDEKEPGLILRVNATGTKTYIALYGRGKRIKIARFGDIPLAVARQKTKEILTAANNGQLDKHLKKKDEEASELTYSEFLETVYLPHLLAKRKTGMETYKMLVSCFVPTFGNLRLSQITFSKIEKWIQDRLLAGIQASTVNRNIASLKASLSYAVRGGHLVVNPSQEIEKLSEDEPKERYLTDDEDPRFYNTLKKYPITEFRVKVTLGIRAGARPCEVAKLIICDIDLRRKSSCAWFECAYTKTKKKRFTPLGRLVRIVLYLYFRQYFRPQGINLFKTFRRVEAAYQKPIFELGSIPDSHRKTWATFMEKARLEQFTPYSMRHDFISKFMMKTGDSYTCAKLVGTSVAMIERHYGHCTPTHAASRIAEMETKKLRMHM